MSFIVRPHSAPPLCVAPGSFERSRLDKELERLTCKLSDCERDPFDELNLEVQAFFTDQLKRNREALFAHPSILSKKVPAGLFCNLMYVAFKEKDKLFDTLCDRCNDQTDLQEIRDANLNPWQLLSEIERRYPVKNKELLIEAVIKAKEDLLLDHVLHRSLDNQNRIKTFTRRDGAGLLHVAAVFGSVHAVERLLEIGCDINQLDRFKRTPLMLAVLAKRCSTMNALIAQGADISYRSAQGNMAIHIAALHDHKAALSPLKQAHDKQGVSIDVRTEKGYTPLLIAQVRNHVNAAQNLLALGARPKKMLLPRSAIKDQQQLVIMNRSIAIFASAMERSETLRAKTLAKEKSEKELAERSLSILPRSVYM